MRIGCGLLFHLPLHSRLLLRRVSLFIAHTNTDISIFIFFSVFLFSVPFMRALPVTTLE